MTATSSSNDHKSGATPALVGGVVAIVVSVGLAISLPLRDVGFNALNVFTLVLAAVAGIQAVRVSRRPDGEGIIWAVSLLAVAILPTVFGWVALLYLPSLILLVVASARVLGGGRRRAGTEYRPEP